LAPAGRRRVAQIAAQTGDAVDSRVDEGLTHNLDVILLVVGIYLCLNFRIERVLTVGDDSRGFQGDLRPVERKGLLRCTTATLGRSGTTLSIPGAGAEQLI